MIFPDNGICVKLLLARQKWIERDGGVCFSAVKFGADRNWACRLPSAKCATQKQALGQGPCR